MRALCSGLLALTLLAGCSDDPLTDPAFADAKDGATTHRGHPVRIGDGSARAYATVLPSGEPVAIGVQMNRSAMNGLPTAFSDQRACYDLDGDGTIEPGMMDGECVVGHEWILDFPDQPGVPFQYVMLNFNPMGHIPPGVYDLPHFDVHFYIQDYAEVMEIDAGPCPVLTDCDDYARAKNLPDAAYYPSTYVDVDAVEPMMGNHLLDPNGPEFDPEIPFTRTFIYGVYDGEITFYEPMITREWLLQQTPHCDPVPQATAWAVPGWYPTSYCSTYERGHYWITIEDFVWREATVAS